MSRPLFKCGKCGSHDLYAKRVLLDGDPTGAWVLVCGNDHVYAGDPDEVIHITGETR